MAKSFCAWPGGRPEKLNNLTSRDPASAGNILAASGRAFASRNAGDEKNGHKQNHISHGSKVIQFVTVATLLHIDCEG